jgi:hypothetical protein
MPDFSAAAKVERPTPRSRTSRIDLTPYKEFLGQYEVGETVDLPLEAGESVRAIKRRLTLASRELEMRLRYPADPDGAVRFKVMPQPETALRTGSPGALPSPPAPAPAPCPQTAPMVLGADPGCSTACSPVLAQSAPP